MVNIPIKIGKLQYFIRSDRYNWMLCFDYKNPKSEKNSYRVEGYYSTLESLLAGVLELKLRASTATTIKGLRRLMTMYKKELTEIYESNFLSDK